MAEMWEHLSKLDGDVPVQQVNKPSDDLTENITIETMRESIRRSGEFVLELDTGKWKCSSKAKLLLGLDKKEGEQLSNRKRVVPDHVSEIQAAIDEAAKTGQFRVVFLVTNDSVNWISGNGELSKDRRTISGTFRDFTDMRLAEVEAELEEAELEEANLRALIADLRSVGAVFYDPLPFARPAGRRREDLNEVERDPDASIARRSDLDFAVTTCGARLTQIFLV